MSIPSSLTPLFSTGSSAAAAAYQVSRSLRFNSADSAYLSRTPAVTGNRRTWTWAAWVKRSALGSGQNLFRGGAGNSNSTYVALYFANDDIRFGGWSSNFIKTTAVFRDCSAWYHIVLTVDTTLTSNRIKLYVNNVEQAITQDGGYPAQNDDLGVNLAQLHTIGGNDLASGYANHYLADIHFIDGQALTPSSFTEVSATTGQLIPKAYAGTYTGNSFWLKFSDNSAATAATLGKDSFLLGNNWTPNNLSVTAGAGNDSLVDTPTSISATDTGVGGEIRGNYATFNPLTAGFGGTLSNGNLDYNIGSGNRRAEGTIAVTSGKWYWEGYAVSGTRNGSVGGRFGFTVTSSLNDPEKTPFQLTFHASNGLYRADSSGSFTLISSGSYTDGDLLGCGLDADSNIGYFYKNGSLIFTFNFSSYVVVGSAFLTPHNWNASSGTPVWEYNFGQRAFAYQTPGTNRPAATFKALCDTNLPAAVVAKPNTVMDVKLYTGNGSTQTISGLNFSPDLVWIKNRIDSSSADHRLYDTVRGATKELYSNLTEAEGTEVNGLTAFSSDGFSVGSINAINGSSDAIVAWTWDAGTSTVSNTAGSITSQVRANASAGFSVITWTGAGTINATVGHGLGVAPKLRITKNRTTGGTGWPVHTTVIDGSLDYLFLNSTAAKGDSSENIDTSTVFSVHNSTDYGASGQNFVTYAFAPVVGYSSFGIYTTTGSADGPFIYTGFRPAFILFKSTSSGQDWVIYDAKRDTYNVVSQYLLANTSAAEATFINLDFLSNGFKLRSTGSLNAPGLNFIYAAFAENPFQYARAR